MMMMMMMMMMVVVNMLSRGANGRMRMRSPTLLIQGLMLEDRFVIMIIVIVVAIIIIITIIIVGHIQLNKFAL